MDEHHVWCKYMDNPHGYSWKDNINRIVLNEENHKRLHKEIILNVLNDYSRALKKYKNEYYIWKNFISPLDKEKVIDEVVKQTLDFYNKLKEEEDESISTI